MITHYCATHPCQKSSGATMCIKASVNQEGYSSVGATNPTPHLLLLPVCLTAGCTCRTELNEDYYSKLACIHFNNTDNCSWVSINESDPALTFEQWLVKCKKNVSWPTASQQLHKKRATDWTTTITTAFIFLGNSSYPTQEHSWLVEWATTFFLVIVFISFL